MQNEKQTISRRDLIIGGAALAAPALVATTAMAEFNTTSSGLTIGTYVSDPNNVDAVNTHWIEAPEGLIVIDVQRLLPEAERARDIMAATGKPIRAVFVTHAHTDHYAGLSVIRAAAPDAEVFAIEPTIRTMRDDTFGFNASRLQRHGNLFPSQEIITEALPERIVSHGERLSLAGLDLEILALTPGESDGTAAIHLPEHRTIFPGDFVQNTKIPVPFESHETWLAQLSTVSTMLDSETMAYQGHGLPAPFLTLAQQTAHYLTTARDKVGEKLDGGTELSEAAIEALVFELSAEFPFHIAGGGFDRTRMITGVSRRFAKQIVEGDAAGPVFANG